MLSKDHQLIRYLVFNDHKSVKSLLNQNPKFASGLNEFVISDDLHILIPDLTYQEVKASTHLGWLADKFIDVVASFSDHDMCLLLINDFSLRVTFSALNTIAHRGETEIFNTFHNSNPTIADKSYGRLLKAACQSGNITLIKQIVEFNHCTLHELDNAIKECASKHHYEGLEFLSQSHAMLTTEIPIGNELINIICENNDIEFAEALLNPSVISKDDYKYRVLRLFDSSIESQDLLSHAVFKQKPALTTLALQNGARVNYNFFEILHHQISLNNMSMLPIIADNITYEELPVIESIFKKDYLDEHVFEFTGSIRAYKHAKELAEQLDIQADVPADLIELNGQQVINSL
ncbi:MAG: hypothetical protein HAW67_04785 [Endozoicomonadaceae bacterium]|nr:hypothetical protein [Endozoicomonadaceae bacterium]